jgi:GNAT superfamily N-acetyltransferase
MGHSQLKFALERADQPEVIALIDALDAWQMVLYPPESHHGVGLDVLLQPNVLFAVARDVVGRAVGCGAVMLQDGYGELKRMYVQPTLRGRGSGRELLMFLEEQAQLRGCNRLRLETGVRQPEALRLYGRSGYFLRPPFGDYAEDPNSVFMEKQLDTGGAA